MIHCLFLNQSTSCYIFLKWKCVFPEYEHCNEHREMGKMVFETRRLTVIREHLLNGIFAQ